MHYTSIWINDTNRNLPISLNWHGRNMQFKTNFSIVYILFGVLLVFWGWCLCFKHARHASYHWIIATAKLLHIYNLIIVNNNGFYLHAPSDVGIMHFYIYSTKSLSCLHKFRSCLHNIFYRLYCHAK